jgi:hypothetical protein
MQRKVSEVVTLAVKFDLENYPPKDPPGEKLITKLETTYKHIAIRGVDKYPAGKPRDLATWCVNEKKELTQHPELLADLNPDYCHNCNSTGKVPGEPIERDGYTYAGEKVPCPVCQSQNVTQIDTTKRVNTETRTNTYLPGGRRKADPLSVSDIAQQMTGT